MIQRMQQVARPAAPTIGMVSRNNNQTKKQTQKERKKEKFGVNDF